MFNEPDAHDSDLPIIDENKVKYEAETNLVARGLYFDSKDSYDSNNMREEMDLTDQPVVGGARKRTASDERVNEIISKLNYGGPVKQTDAAEGGAVADVLQDSPVVPNPGPGVLLGLDRAEDMYADENEENGNTQVVLSYWNDISEGFKPRKNRFIATGLTPKVSDLSTTPSSAGAPRQDPRLRGRAHGGWRQVFVSIFWAHFCNFLSFLVISARNSSQRSIFRGNRGTISKNNKNALQKREVANLHGRAPPSLTRSEVGRAPVELGHGSAAHFPVFGDSSGSPRRFFRGFKPCDLSFQHLRTFSGTSSH
jgi:hypothetical protein